MYFPKQHYESIVPEKSGINRFSASHDIHFISVYISFVLNPSTYSLKPPLRTMKLSSRKIALTSLSPHCS